MSTNHPAPPLPSQSPSPSLSLPSSRDFMTSLFNSLTSSSRSSTSPIQTSDRNITSDSILYTRRFSKEDERDDGNGNGNGNGNPLKQLDAQKKALLMTLHVIFPPPLLLHALDLLDRGGVGRVVLKGEGGTEEGISKREGLGDRRDDARGNMEQDVSSEREKEAESRRNLKVEDTEVGATTTKAHNPQATPSTSTSTCASACISPHKNYSPLAPVHPSPNHRSPPKTKPPILYQVRSSQPPKWHSSRSASGIGIGTGHASASATAENTYTVHLDAWNCSCAAFAFSAFPASSSSTHPYPYISTSTSTSTSSTSYFPWSLKESSPDEECLNSVEKGEGKGKGKGKRKGKKEEEKWQYGGWTKTSQVPICKHLLACLLVERWSDVLGMYVRERVVGREEMGGLVG
ncbi:uncharacterized protein EAF02_008709 [Botrytis sinoallii]|uniref:uncharacterized protein n=1 Tax=Botrytis sinoallii TaxID=1463999 RepID=UPI0018FF8CE4|nr:uncharacterized protein EAF02_008709 [Botrytis sinoallii]KAF7874732.1 hypothetical protein EAF02_008709 [Botrytis sinoallii]